MEPKERLELGLGLDIAHEVATAHDGKLGVTSTDEGDTLCVETTEGAA